MEQEAEKPTSRASADSNEGHAIPVDLGSIRGLIGRTSTKRDGLPRMLEDLRSRFDFYARAYDDDPPFKKREQLITHREAILARRRALSSAAEALASDLFLKKVREVLVAWGMDRQGARLAPIESFKASIRAMGAKISELERFSIDCAPDQLEAEAIPLLTEVVLGLNINEDVDAKVVVGTKALHHIIPDLVPPIDRKYTGRFFSWYNAFNYDQEKVISEALLEFNGIARAVEISNEFGTGWRTSRTKILDNAVVAYCGLELGVKHC